MWDDLFRNVDYLKKGMDASALRDQVIRNNIANSDTPDFKASEVEFEDIFAATVAANTDTSPGELKMTRTNEMHISGEQEPVDLSGVTPGVFTEETSIRYDQNNMDVEVEMAALAKNSIEYYSLVEKMNSEFNRLRTAISGNV